MNRLTGITAEGADRVRGNDLFLDVVDQGHRRGAGLGVRPGVRRGHVADAAGRRRG
jgi:hypothetical protein